jgi:uncharacterized coiled-coil protein SlyX
VRQQEQVTVGELCEAVGELWAHVEEMASALSAIATQLELDPETVTPEQIVEAVTEAMQTIADLESLTTGEDG